MSKYQVEIPEFNEFSSLLKKRFEENSLGLYFTNDNAEKFYTLTKMLVETNSKMNLTAIRDVDATIVKHYCNCGYDT